MNVDVRLPILRPGMVHVYVAFTEITVPFGGPVALLSITAMITPGNIILVVRRGADVVAITVCPQCQRPAPRRHALR